jgi:predicted DNA-binding helix-hairpin-helix protein
VSDPFTDRITVLAAAARFDICTRCDSPFSPTEAGPLAGSITSLLLPGGRRLSVLKTLLTDDCQYDCAYCANRVQRHRRRYAMTPDELASAFMELHSRGLVTGLFLSSAIRGSAGDSMAEMITAVEILRARHRFTGYVHLKVLPGAPYDCVERAVELADRVSVNMEAPTQAALNRLSGRKQLDRDIIQRMHWVRQACERASRGKLKSGQTTQFVVGAAGESDRDILNATEGLRRSVGIRRAYFSAFRPIPDTPLEGEPAAARRRQHRLYEADWLLRHYGFGLSEIVFDRRGNLPLSLDPKLAFALRESHRFPVEVNRGSEAELLHVPGIGPRSARRLLAARRRGRLTSLDDLRRLGVVTSRAALFVLVDGRLHQGLSPSTGRRPRAAQGQLELPLWGQIAAPVGYR